MYNHISPLIVITRNRIAAYIVPTQRVLYSIRLQYERQRGER